MRPMKNKLKKLAKKVLGQTHNNEKLQEVASAPYNEVPFADMALQKLCEDFEFDTVLDVGSGAGLHADLFKKVGKEVTAVDFGTSIYFKQRDDKYEYYQGDFMEIDFGKKFDCVWASHVLEHQPNPGKFIERLIDLTIPGGIIAISVPPLKHDIVGGHLTLWNAGLLLYNLVFAGLDCSSASVRTYGYNISVITRNIKRNIVTLDYDSGDINKLANYFPMKVGEGFDGRIKTLNW